MDIAVLKVAVRIYQFSEGKVSLNRSGRIQSERCSAINIPHCFLFATEQNAFPEHWIRRGAARGNLFGRTDMIKLLLSRISQSFSNNATVWTSEENRFDSRQEKETYFFSNGTGIFPWGRWKARRKIDRSPNLAQRFNNYWRCTTIYTCTFFACSGKKNIMLQ